MSDPMTEIPSLAYINAQIIQSAFSAGELAAATDRVESYYGLPSHSLKVMNPAYLISLLYCLIVVPKQLWLGNGLPLSLVTLDARSVLSQVDISIRPPDFDKDLMFQFLRRLRNAIAHVRFSISNEGQITFWDQPGEQSPRCFQASMSLEALGEFLSIVGPALANLRNVR
jgi:hypothetical protein